jgi:hypothetical protein
MRVKELTAELSPWGLRTVSIENELLRFAVLPEAGAKIISVIHKPTGKEILWRNAQTPPACVAAGSNFDDNWAGGWDELFPNDEPASLQGDCYPDHGELWSSNWAYDVESRDGCAVLALSTECAVSGCRFEKWISLREGESRLRFRHRLTNLRERPFRCLWKLHPAMAVAAGDRILIPARRFELEPECLGSLAGGPPEWRGPVVKLPGGEVDVSVVPARESRQLQFLYGLDLVEGWCATYDPVLKLAAGLTFPKDLFTSCWLFASYGGWREHYVAVLEPCTGYPYRLDKAAAAGQCLSLEPLGRREAEVIFTVRAGLPGVTRITPDGEFE